MKWVKKNIASFDVDAEKCFTPLCPKELPVENGHLIVNELNAQAKHAQFRIGSKDAHSPFAVWVTQDPAEIAKPIKNPGPNADLKWTLHGVPGTKGFELLDGLPTPSEYDYFVWKGIEVDFHPYGACYHTMDEKLSTGVIEFLNSKNIHCVLIGGLALDFCVGITALQLSNAGFRVIVNKAATRGITDGGIQKMLVNLKDKGVEIIDSAIDINSL